MPWGLNGIFWQGSSAICLIHTGKADRFLQMPVYHWFGHPQRVPFDDIAFIASSDEPDLLLQIHIAEQHFETAMEVLRIRTEKTEGLLNSPETQIEQFELDSGNARINA